MDILPNQRFRYKLIFGYALYFKNFLYIIILILDGCCDFLMLCFSESGDKIAQENRNAISTSAEIIRIQRELTWRFRYKSFLREFRTRE